MGTQMSITIGSIAVIVGVGDRLMTTDGDGRWVGRTNGARVDVPVTGGGRGVGMFDVDKDVNSRDVLVDGCN